MVIELINSHLSLVSTIGAIPLVIGPPAIVVSVLFIKKKLNKELITLILVLFSYFFNVLLKLFFAHTRPETASTQFFLDRFSFPSSHTLVYTVFFGYIFILTFKYHMLDKFIKFIVRFWCAYFIVFVGVSRIFLGQHWVSDVIGGYLLGLFYLFAVLLLLGEKSPRKRVRGK